VHALVTTPIGAWRSPFPATSSSGNKRPTNGAITAGDLGGGRCGGGGGTEIDLLRPNYRLASRLHSLCPQYTYPNSFQPHRLRWIAATPSRSSTCSLHARFFVICCCMYMTRTLINLIFRSCNIRSAFQARDLIDLMPMRQRPVEAR